MGRLRTIRVGDMMFRASAIAFDKDGTLIDLDATWAPVARAWLDLVSTAGLSESAVARLAEAIGFSDEENRLVPDGVFAAGTLEQVTVVINEFLISNGLSRELADELVVECISTARNISADPALLRTIGNVAAVFERLTNASIDIGVVTSDEHATAKANLEALGLDHHVGVIIGSDDIESPKPSPLGLLKVAKHFGITPDQMLVVGDSSADMEAAARAGVGGRIAVGLDSPAARSADIVIGSIEEIDVVDP